MNDTLFVDMPKLYPSLTRKAVEIGFTMPADVHIGSLLKTLIASKPNGRFLELGTGIGISLSWMVEGMGMGAQLVSLDNSPNLVAIAEKHFGKDPRVTLLCEDGGQWLKTYKGEKFDLIFADAWPGKYQETEVALALVKPGGFYVIDDMNTQANWPEGHQDHVDRLIAYLDAHKEFTLTKLNWSSGLIIAVRDKTGKD